MLVDLQSSFFPVKSSKLIPRCPLCKNSKDMIAKVVDENRDAHLVHASCLKCGRAMLVAVLGDAHGAISAGLITDLIWEDVVKFKNFSCVTADDVLDMHRFLETADFNFCI